MRILAVDDEKTVRHMLKELLRRAGHEVTTAASGIEAFAHVRTRRFDLILLDLIMPGMDGYQLAQYLSNNWDTFDIPVIVISGRTDAESKSWVTINGCVRYIEKPFRVGELLDAISEVERGESEVVPTGA